MLCIVMLPFGQLWYHFVMIKIIFSDFMTTP
jgi:hypothetical protein